MKKFLAAGLAAILLGGSASAQTIDVPGWTGLYAGIHGGYGIDDDAKATVAGDTPNNLLALNAGIRTARISQRRTGFLGGGQLGYNMQSGNIVYGVEGDFSYMDTRGSSTYRSPQTILTFPAGRREYLKSDLDWMATARGRIGYVAGTGMIYGTGGYAAGRVKGSVEFDGDTDSVVNYYGKHSYIASGWTAGGGGEFRPFATGPMSRVSVRLETLYYDLGRSHISAGQVNTPPGFYTIGVATKGWNTRLGVNFLF